MFKTFHNMQPLKDTDGPMIALREVHKAYRTPAGEFPALRGVSLTLNEGDFLAIIGKSGAGKSTMINCVTGIDTPDSGEILLNGAALHTMGEDKRSRWRGHNMGVVFQFFQLLPNLTLIENICIPMDFTGRYSLRERRERALHLLELVDIAEHAHKTPNRISGGQQQRVAVARALANDPPILVADEPTGNLDSKTAAAIFELFEMLVYEKNKTLLMVTHDRSIATRASRVIEMADGVIVE
jgi:putative ABC transport system ATP-binding protein